MQQHQFGRLWPVSALTLGGGGLGMVWGETTFEECVATVHDAVAAGINLIDLAPRYGDGKAEEVVGAAFGGRLPEGVRVTSKCNLGNAPRAEIEHLLRQSIEGSLKRLRLSRLDLFFLHSAPAAVQCIANLLDSPGALKFFDGPAKPRAVMEAARANGVGVMGIRAVQAGALTSTIDRPLPAAHPEMRDYAGAAGFRRLAAELGVSSPLLAHRYALSLPVDTVVLGVQH